MYVGSRQELPSDLSIWNGSTVPRCGIRCWQVATNCSLLVLAPETAAYAATRHLGSALTAMKPNDDALRSVCLHQSI